MSKEFDEALEDVFEERAKEFGAGARELLEELFGRGKLAGRELERQDQRQLGLEKAVRSECGNYLCIPVPKEMLVLEGAEAGAARLENEIRTRQRQLGGDANPMSEMMAAMDGEILEKLASQARALEPRQPLGLVLATPRAPRVPARQPANQMNWEEASSLIKSIKEQNDRQFQQMMYGSYASMVPPKKVVP